MVGWEVRWEMSGMVEACGMEIDRDEGGKTG